MVTASAENLSEQKGEAEEGKESGDSFESASDYESESDEGSDLVRRRRAASDDEDDEVREDDEGSGDEGVSTRGGFARRKGKGDEVNEGGVESGGEEGQDVEGNTQKEGKGQETSNSEDDRQGAVLEEGEVGGLDESGTETTTGEEKGEQDVEVGAGVAEKPQPEPFVVPTSGVFWMHDDRFSGEGPPKQRRGPPAGKKLWEANDGGKKWGHDGYDELMREEQTDNAAGVAVRHRGGRGGRGGGRRGQGGRGRGGDPNRQAHPLPEWAEDNAGADAATLVAAFPALSVSAQPLRGGRGRGRGLRRGILPADGNAMTSARAPSGSQRRYSRMGGAADNPSAPGFGKPDALGNTNIKTAPTHSPDHSHAPRGRGGRGPGGRGWSSGGGGAGTSATIPSQARPQVGDIEILGAGTTSSIARKLPSAGGGAAVASRGTAIVRQGYGVGRGVGRKGLVPNTVAATSSFGTSEVAGEGQLASVASSDAQGSGQSVDSSQGALAATVGAQAQVGKAPGALASVQQSVEKGGPAATGGGSPAAALPNRAGSVSSPGEGAAAGTLAAATNSGIPQLPPRVGPTTGSSTLEGGGQGAGTRWQSGNATAGSASAMPFVLRSGGGSGAVGSVGQSGMPGSQGSLIDGGMMGGKVRGVHPVPMSGMVNLGRSSGQLGSSPPVSHGGFQGMGAVGAMGMAGGGAGFVYAGAGSSGISNVALQYGQSQAGLGVPAVGMTMPPYPNQSQYAYPNSEVTWVPVLAPGGAMPSPAYGSTYLPLEPPPSTAIYYQTPSAQAPAFLPSGRQDMNGSSKPPGGLWKPPPQGQDLVAEDFARQSKLRRYSEMSFGQ